MAELSLRRLLIKNTGVQMVAHVVLLAVGLATICGATPHKGGKQV